MMYVRFPLSLRNVEELLAERGIDICHETERHRWTRFGPMFAGEVRRQRVSAMRGFRHWRWHVDEIYVKLNGEMVYRWRGLVRPNAPLLKRSGTIRRNAPLISYLVMSGQRPADAPKLAVFGRLTFRLNLCEFRPS
jgi:putative transposase